MISELSLNVAESATQIICADLVNLWWSIKNN